MEFPEIPFENWVGVLILLASRLWGQGTMHIDRRIKPPVDENALNDATEIVTHTLNVSAKAVAEGLNLSQLGADNDIDRDEISNELGHQFGIRNPDIDLTMNVYDLARVCCEMRLPNRK